MAFLSREPTGVIWPGVDAMFREGGKSGTEAVGPAFVSSSPRGLRMKPSLYSLTSVDAGSLSILPCSLLSGCCVLYLRIRT